MDTSLIPSKENKFDEGKVIFSVIMHFAIDRKCQSFPSVKVEQLNDKISKESES